ncbi:hypothetical protein B0H13DRAFT_2368942 [Mycena leptocephala]|nr:hypothetical protein B0H13DRAFT_2368942 [Mycena leptocephala]
MSTTKLILVIGATGAQGLTVIDALLGPDANGKVSPYSAHSRTKTPWPGPWKEFMEYGSLVGVLIGAEFGGSPYTRRLT